MDLECPGCGTVMVYYRSDDRVSFTCPRCGYRFVHYVVEESDAATPKGCGCSVVPLFWLALGFGYIIYIGI